MSEALLWVAMAGLTAAAVIAVIAPLLRASAAPAGPDDAAVYRDQLRELEREQARGTIAEPEAQAARAEIGRRLIGAVRTAKPALPPSRDRKMLAQLLLLGIPALALGIYLSIGSPDLPGQPLAARLAAPPDQSDPAALIARAEAELARHPERVEGWQLMAPIYMRLGRFADAAMAYGKLISLAGDTAERATMYGVALVGQAGGVVTADARAAFDRALKLDPTYAQARVSVALAKEQEGDASGALGDMRAVLADMAADDPMRAGVRREIARMEAPKMSGPTAADMADAAGMTPEQQQAMARGMVEGLQARLSAQGGGIDEWLRLVRSYSVLGEPDKARTAMAGARKAYSADPDALAKIDALAASLGLGS